MEYENTMLKFKNKDYIKKLLDKYNFWQNSILKKERILNYTTQISFGFVCILPIIAAILNNKLFMMGFMLFTFVSLAGAIFSQLGVLNKNEDKQLEILNDKFVEDVRANPSILQDLSTLVVDKSSKNNFIYLADIILSQEDFPRALEMLADILEHSPNPLYTFSHEEKRNKLMKNLNIDLNIKEDVSVKNKVNYKQETKQKLLGML